MNFLKPTNKHFNWTDIQPHFMWEQCEAPTSLSHLMSKAYRICEQFGTSF